MGICKRRYFFFTICLLQLLSVIERQVFDFLGFLWIPILVNFFEIIFIIFGFFGAFQYRPKYIISYSAWHLFWLAWNIFLICLYLDVAGLNHKESKVLKLDPGSGSWWQNGPGCTGILNTTIPIPVVENVTNCLVDYRHVEIFQAGLQCVLSFLGTITGFCLSRMFLEEDDSFNYLGGDSKGPQHLALQPMYVSSDNIYHNHHHHHHPPFSKCKTNTNKSDRTSIFQDGGGELLLTQPHYCTKRKSNLRSYHSDLIRVIPPSSKSAADRRPKSLNSDIFLD